MAISLFVKRMMLLIKCTLSGAICESDVNECDLFQPCQNNASCTDRQNDFTCHCLPGWTGESLITSLCINTELYFKLYSVKISIKLLWVNCKFEPYLCTGTTCSIPINECAVEPCVFGSCIDEQASHRCVCDPGYTGTLVYKW